MNVDDMDDSVIENTERRIGVFQVFGVGFCYFIRFAQHVHQILFGCSQRYVDSLELSLTCERDEIFVNNQFVVGIRLALLTVRGIY